jgi:hypothetical protein
MPAIAPPLNPPPPPPPPDEALLVVALGLALVVVDVELPDVDPPPSAGADWPGTSI